jgi:hypothetical protein
MRVEVTTTFPQSACSNEVVTINPKKLLRNYVKRVGTREFDTNFKYSAALLIKDMMKVYFKFDESEVDSWFPVKNYFFVTFVDDCGDTGEEVLLTVQSCAELNCEDTTFHLPTNNDMKSIMYYKWICCLYYYSEKKTLPLLHAPIVRTAFSDFRNVTFQNFGIDHIIRDLDKKLERYHDKKNYNSKPSHGMSGVI